MYDVGRLLLVVGVIAVLVGALLMLGPRVPWLGRLPGDIVIRRGNTTFYFPLATSLLVSIVASILLSLFTRR